MRAKLVNESVETTQFKIGELFSIGKDKYIIKNTYKIRNNDVVTILNLSTKEKQDVNTNWIKFKISSTNIDKIVTVRHSQQPKTHLSRDVNVSRPLIKSKFDKIVKDIADRIISTNKSSEFNVDLHSIVYDTAENCIYNDNKVSDYIAKQYQIYNDGETTTHRDLVEYLINEIENYL